MRLTRSAMLDVLGTEYIKLARMKGLPERQVIWKHALKNAAPPVVTFAALLFVSLLNGSIIVETVLAGRSRPADHRGGAIPGLSRSADSGVVPEWYVHHCQSAGGCLVRLSQSQNSVRRMTLAKSVLAIRQTWQARDLPPCCPSWSWGCWSSAPSLRRSGAAFAYRGVAGETPDPAARDGSVERRARARH